MRRVLLLVAVGLLVAFAVNSWLGLGGLFLRPGSCGEKERKAYAEFPQYGGVEIEPEASTESGGCAVFYDTRSSQERIAEYYTE